MINQLNALIISSYDLNLVSGIQTRMNNVLDKQNIANKNIVPWNLSVSIRNGSSLTRPNASIHKRATQNEIPKSLIFSGITSEKRETKIID